MVGVGVALRAGELGGAGADVEEQLLVLVGHVGHGEGGRRGGDVEDRVHPLAVVHLARLGVGDLRLVLVIGRDDLDVLGDRVVGVRLLEVVDGHLHRLDRVLTGELGVDAGQVGDHAEHDLVVADLAAAAGGAAPAAGGESAESQGAGDRPEGAHSAHERGVLSDVGSDAEVLEELVLPLLDLRVVQ